MYDYHFDALVCCKRLTIVILAFVAVFFVVPVWFVLLVLIWLSRTPLAKTMLLALFAIAVYFVGMAHLSVLAMDWNEQARETTGFATNLPQ